MPKSDSQIKALRSQKSDLKDKIVAAQQQVSYYKKQISELTHKKNTIEQKLGNLLRKNETLEVTDHAIVRYLERIRGISIEQVKNEIMTERFLELFEQLGNSGEYPSGNKFQVVVRNKRIVTIKD